ncbi:MAG: hypothetical protein WCZ21_05445 [Bacteroidales bacterium]
MDTKTYHTEKYDEALLKIEHFSKFNHMIPFVGNQYEKFNILIIAESFYLPQESTIHLDKKWYQKSTKDLNKEECEWTSPVYAICDFLKNEKVDKGHTIYLNLKNALEKALDMETKDVYKYIAYYNYFQRPAKYTESIEITSEDKDVSNKVFTGILNILKPNLIVVTSSKCRDNITFPIEIKDKIIFTPHPVSVWWNRKDSNNNIGKNKFIDSVKAIIK